MSSEVYIQAIRINDICPYSRVYLGGNSLAREIKENNPLEATVMGCYVAKFQDSETMKDFLSKYSEQISNYGGYMDLDEDFPYPLDDFYYWLLIEE